jgi:hypothetical protein
MTEVKKEFTSVTMDTDLEDIPDLPSFSVWPTGSYAVVIDKWEEKEVADNAGLEITFKLVEKLEVTEEVSESEMPKEGDSMSMFYNFDNEFGGGNLKKFLKPFSEHFGAKRVGEILEQINGTACMIVSKRKPSKKDPEKMFADIKQVSIL